MFAFITLIALGINVYYAFDPSPYIPAWLHVVAAVLCGMTLIRLAEDG